MVTLSPCCRVGGGHPEQPGGAVREEGQVQGGRATLQESAGDPGEGTASQRVQMHTTETSEPSHTVLLIADRCF